MHYSEMEAALTPARRTSLSIWVHTRREGVLETHGVVVAARRLRGSRGRQNGNGRRTQGQRQVPKQKDQREELNVRPRQVPSARDLHDP